MSKYGDSDGTIISALGTDKHLIAKRCHGHICVLACHGDKTNGVNPVHMIAAADSEDILLASTSRLG